MEMTTCEDNKRRTNWGMVFFTIIVGLILLTNLFNYITWRIWEIGIYLIGGIIFLNILYRLLCNKKWAFKTFQVIVFFLVLILLSHTVLAVVKPGHLGPEISDSTPYEIYNSTMELRTEYYPNTVNLKDVTFNINEKEYSLLDSNNNFYYFRTHPPKGDNTDIFIGHRIANSELKVDIDSTNYKLTPLQKFIQQHPSVILGASQIPTDLEINSNNDGILNINLEGQRIENLRGVLRGGEINLKFSTESVPTTRFLLTVRDGNHTLSLPKEIGHKIKYNVKGEGELTIDGNKVRLAGNYDIISSRGENPCSIEVNVNGGQIEIVTH